MNKRIPFLFLILLLGKFLNAQTEQINLVEHFTNTSCSVCAANNESIYNAIRSNPGTLHISYHPSSPYTNDVFNVQNKQENDSRTKYYQLYGSTPKTVLNGVAIPFNSLSLALSNSSSKKSNWRLQLSYSPQVDDSFLLTISIKKLTLDTISSVQLLASLLEDTVFWETFNGEKVHYNVFRKAISQVNGNTISLPIIPGDSSFFSWKFKPESAWDFNKLNALVFLQLPNKQVVQASILPLVSLSNSLPKFNKEQVKDIVYPNPINNHLVFAATEAQVLQWINANGVVVKSLSNIQANEMLDVSDLQAGIYVVKRVHHQKLSFQKIQIN